MITIITSTLNSANSFIKTMNSIKAQSYKDIQWIVIDGKSKDDTVDIIKSNEKYIAYWISEFDTGIYNAWNKACKFIKGDWVIFLGSGDIFINKNTLKNVVKKLNKLPINIDIVYGNVRQEDDRFIFYHSGKIDLEEWDAYRPKLPPHQGIFHRSQLFQGKCPFDESYRIVSDSKFLLQKLRDDNVMYLDIDICSMQAGGVSSNPKFALVAMKEFLFLEKELNYELPFLLKCKFVLISYFRYLNFRLRKKLKMTHDELY